MMPKYRIIYNRVPSDPCIWQLQQRVYFFFWEEMYNFSSATSAANEILELMKDDT